MRILMVEDDEKLCEAVAYQLEKEGFLVDVCNDGEDGLHWIRQQAHELILLDRMLPSLSGTSVLKKMRAEKITIPVLLLTALGSVENRVEGLDAGADDYLVKPFAMEELLARVRAMCRRPRQWESTSELCCGDIQLHPNEKILVSKKSSATLSRRELDLMEVLMKNIGQTLPRQVLLAKVWGPDAPVEDGNLDNYIYFLRRRLKEVGSQLSIKTVRGIGYLLEQKDV